MRATFPGVSQVGFDDPDQINAAVTWVLDTFPLIAGIATAGEVSLMGMFVAAEAAPMSLAEADAVLSAVEDYASPFV